MARKYSRTKKRSKSSKKDSSSSSSYLKTLSENSTASEKGEHLWNAEDAVEYVSKKLGIELDQWQKDYINAEGDTAVRAGRQSGKSFAQSIRTAIFCMKYKKEKGMAEPTVLITGGVERQAYELYMKVQRIILAIAPKMERGRTTMQRMTLSNGLRILALPCGRDGAGLRNYAVIRLVVDEAHYVHDDVYTAVEPMLATTGGFMDLLSTPRGNKGRFYEAFQEGSGFTTFHTTSEECPRIPEDFLEKKRKSMTKLQYAQEYLAEFLDSLQQFFPRSMIDACIRPEVTPFSSGRFFLGVDVARYGGDENAFVVVSYIRNKIRVVHIETTERVAATDTIDRIIDLNTKYNFKKIYIDDGGVGGPVLDVLLKNKAVKRKMKGLNNASRSVLADPKKKKGKKIMKEDLYGNTRRMMERAQIILPDNIKMMESLLSIQFEYTDNNNLRIFGRYSHIAEAMVRACWCEVEKSLNIWFA
ncbi:MAG: hypothetical protein CMI54_01800 [Parcubacteria group bacterium]|nr:hypothetical protein [Parcubacteria group bacterium]|tara:strand:+ start:905 stop:2320 length:1416 start_codon:yes stop_codon:yes gene_type:complete